jgi:hypothetical protein
MTDQVLSNDARWQKVVLQNAATITHLLDILLKEKGIKESKKSGKG